MTKDDALAEIRRLFGKTRFQRNISIPPDVIVALLGEKNEKPPHMLTRAEAIRMLAEMLKASQPAPSPTMHQGLLYDSPISIPRSLALAIVHPLATLIDGQKVIDVGDRVKRVGGEYEFEGEVVERFAKRNGKSIRLVVEDDRGLCFIMSEKGVEKV